MYVQYACLIFFTQKLCLPKLDTFVKTFSHDLRDGFPRVFTTHFAKNSCKNWTKVYFITHCDSIIEKKEKSKHDTAWHNMTWHDMMTRRDRILLITEDNIYLRNSIIYNEFHKQKYGVLEGWSPGLFALFQHLNSPYLPLGKTWGHLSKSTSQWLINCCKLTN